MLLTVLYAFTCSTQGDKNDAFTRPPNLTLASCDLDL